jgi:penicillin-binding protein 1C
LEVERPGAEASWRDFAAPRQVAWKTGTSFGFRDGWAVGVTPRWAVGVWVGNADGEGRPGLTGVGTAAPLMFDIFAALPPSPWFTEPTAELVPLTVCRHSGQRAGPHCADTEVISAPRAGLSGHVCGYCQSVALDSGERFRVHDGCAAMQTVHLVRRFVLPTHMEWFYRMRHADYLPLPPWRDDCLMSLGDTGSSLSILYPRTDGAIYVPIELDGERGRTVFEAAHRDVRARLFWHLDDQYLGATRSIHQLALAPTPGPHTLTVMDERGERASRRFVVLEKESSAAGIGSGDGRRSVE